MTLPQAQSARDKLVLEYRAYTHNIVGKLIQSMNLPRQLFEEFLSAGFLGLVEAAGRYDPASGKSFKNFAFFRIRGAVIDSIRENADSKCRAYQRVKALHARNASENRSSSTDAPAPTQGARDADTELAEVLDVAAKGLLAYRLSIVDAEPEISEEDDDGLRHDPESVYLHREAQQQLRDLVAALPKKERLVIEEFYFNDRPFLEIIEKHEGLSKSWASRLHSRALESLKTALLKKQEESE